MDFALTQDQQDLASLVDKILGDLARPEYIPSFEDPQDWYDEGLWQELAKTQLLGVALSEDVGGMGLGLTEVCILLEAAGRTVAAAPLLPTLLLGAAPIDRFGNRALRKELLPAVVGGNSVLTAALANEGASSPLDAEVRATLDGSSWRLQGTRAFVPAARLATAILIPARVGNDGLLGVFAVPSDVPGVTLEPQATTTGELQYRIVLENVRVGENSILGDPASGKTIVAWITERALAGLCALELGVAQRALRMTAEYTGQRKQFGKIIATFQAVAQRAADAYIDVEAIRLATWQAIWRLDAGLPARRELAIAKFWASEGGHRACYAAQHLHGGIGVDTDYPLHHYYLLSRQIELTLGGAHTHLEYLGRRLAEEKLDNHG